MGEYVLKGLHEMKERTELMGDVRGVGLYLGVYLVRRKHAKELALKEAERVVKRAFDKGALFALDVPDILGEEVPMRNVIKVRPTLVVKKRSR